MAILFAIPATRARAFIIIGTALSVSAAALIVGCLLGLLFGMPRTVSGEGSGTDNAVGRPPPPQSDARRALSDSPGAGRGPFAPNTNLDQISDWLTKILVGAGLTQLNHLPDLLGRLGNAMGAAIGPTDAVRGTGAASVLGAALAVYYVTAGFLYGYLWGKSEGGELLAEGARSLSLDRLEAAMDDTVRRIARANAKALSLVEGQLHPGTDAFAVAEAELVEAVRAATADTRVEIFTRARRFRKSAEDPNDRTEAEKIGRVEAIFRALIACDTQDKYDRNHAQLAYAIMSSPTVSSRDLFKAKQELTEAIDICERSDTPVRWLYYANRALCTIRSATRDEHGERKLSSQDTEQAKSDLAAAAGGSKGGRLARFDEELSRWAVANNVRMDET